MKVVIQALEKEKLMNARCALLVIFLSGLTFSGSADYLSALTMETQQDFGGTETVSEKGYLLGGSILHEACRIGDANSVKMILQNPEASSIIFQKNSAGCSAFNYAIWRTDWSSEVKKEIINLFIICAGYRDYELIAMTDNAAKTTWYYAYRIGCFDAVKAFVTVAAKHNKIWDLISKKEGDSGWTPLHVAVALKFRNIVEYLLQVAGSRAAELVGIKDFGGQTALDWNKIEGDHDGIRNLLEKALASKSLDQSTRNWTELHDACKRGDFTAAENILHQAGQALDLVFMHDSSGQTPLSYAISSNDKYRLVDLLIKYSGNHAYELITMPDNAKLTPWHYAVCMGDLVLVKTFVLVAAQRNAVWDLIARAEGDSGWTPLHWAVILKNKSLVEYLLHLAGVRAFDLVSIPDHSGQTALDWNRLYNNAPDIKKLLESVLAGNRFDSQAHSEKINALFLACQSGNFDAVTTILSKAGKQGIDYIFARDNLGRIPMVYALMHKDAGQIVDLFFWCAAHRAYELITTVDNTRITPWYHAVASCDVHVLQLFIEVARGLNWLYEYDAVWALLSKKEGSPGWTSLHHAAVYNKKDVVEYLLKVAGKRAPELILMPGYAKETPLDWARRQKNHAIVAIFENVLKG